MPVRSLVLGPVALLEGPVITVVRRTAVPAVVSAALSLASAGLAAPLGADGSRHEPLPVGYRAVPALQVSVDGVAASDAGGVAGGGGGVCPPQVSTHTSSDFGPGTYILQGGFAEGEIAAVSFTLDPEDFPLKLDLAEMIFGTSGAGVPTTTEWSFLVWEGFPNSGTLLLEASSIDKLLPQIILPPGTSGVNVQVQVDPNDPKQIVILDNGSHTFSIGYRIDEHNQQTQNPCLIAPPTCCNAFPATDVGGLASPSGNWLFALNCGPLGCPAGWKTFAQLGLCQPSGDWVIRATWSPFNCSGEQTGACCFGDGTCSVTTQSSCVGFGGTWQGAGTACGPDTCPQGTVPCCFPATSGCLDLPVESCLAAGGVPGQPGASCATSICFPSGACCLPDGGCVDDVSPEACAALGGVFQGDGTACATTTCPEPLGACCFATGFCLELTQANCELTGATWGGPGTDCDDGNANGTPDACEEASVVGDFDGDGLVNGADLGILLGQWGGRGPADLDGNGVVDGADLGVLLGNWTG